MDGFPKPYFLGGSSLLPISPFLLMHLILLQTTTATNENINEHWNGIRIFLSLFGSGLYPRFWHVGVNNK